MAGPGDITILLRRMGEGDDTSYDTLHEEAPSRRPRWFNQFFKALIRYMADAFDNDEAAYAMDRTGRFFPITQDVQAKTPEQKKWWAAREEFRLMSEDARFAWRDGVGEYPDLQDTLAKPRTPATRKRGAAT